MLFDNLFLALGPAVTSVVLACILLAAVVIALAETTRRHGQSSGMTGHGNESVRVPEPFSIRAGDEEKPKPTESERHGWSRPS